MQLRPAFGAVLLLILFVFVPCADAAVAFRSLSYDTCEACYEMTIDVPDGVQDGDLLYAFIAIEDDEAIPTPSGWTLIRSTSNDFRLATFYRIASGEPDDYAWGTSWNAAVGVIAAYTGVATTSPLDAESERTGSSSYNVRANSVTTTQNNDLLVATFFMSTDGDFLPPGTMTERWDLGSDNDVAGAVADEIFATTGATGTRIAIASDEAESYIAHMAAFKAASSVEASTALSVSNASINNYMLQ